MFAIFQVRCVTLFNLKFPRLLRLNNRTTTETLVSLKQKCIFEHNREFQSRKTLLIDIIFATEKISVDLFRAAAYMIMLVLHKDALFHYAPREHLKYGWPVL